MYSNATISEDFDDVIVGVVLLYFVTAMLFNPEFGGFQDFTDVVTGGTVVI